MTLIQKKTDKDSKKQGILFIKAATEHEADMDESKFEQVVQQIAKPQPITPKNDGENQPE